VRCPVAPRRFFVFQRWKNRLSLRFFLIGMPIALTFRAVGGTAGAGPFPTDSNQTS
jgi:hypothetical protein